MSVIIKRAKTDTAGSRGHTRLSDFDDLTKSLVDETIAIYQAQIIAVQPWPSTAKNQEYISQAWVEVCSARNVLIELDDEIFKVVTDHATQARGHAKTISKPYVVSAFFLDAPTSKHAIHDKVEQLLDEAQYIYKALSVDCL